MHDIEQDIDPFTHEAIRLHEEGQRTEEDTEDKILARLQDRCGRLSRGCVAFIGALQALAHHEKEVVFDVIIDSLKHEIRRETAIATLTVIRSSTNPHLSIDCVKLLTGIATQEGKRGVDYAKKHGIGRAAVSKEVRLLNSVLHLRKSVDTRSDDVRDSSRQREDALNAKVKQKLRLALNRREDGLLTDEQLKQQVATITEQYPD